MSALYEVVQGGIAQAEDLNQYRRLFRGGVVYDAKQYGAVGDGATDDTVAIQAAIDACDTGGGGTVVFPRGRYLLTASLSVPSFVTLQGASLPYRASEWDIDPTTAASVLKASGAANFPLVTNSDPTNGNVSIGLSRLKFIGGSNGDTKAVVFDKVRRSIISECYVFGPATTSRIGVYIIGGSELIRIDKCVFEGNGIRSDGGSTSVYITGCEIGAAGIHLDGGYAHQITDCQIYFDGVAAGQGYSQWPVGIRISVAHEVLIRGNHILAAQQDGVLLDSCDHCKVIDNWLIDSSRQTVNVWGGVKLECNTAVPCEYNTISGNHGWDRAGTYQRAGAILVSTAGTTRNNTIVDNDFRGNVSTAVLDVSGQVNLIRRNGETVQTVASAATLTLPQGEFITVSGTTSITSITAVEAQRRVMLKFSGILTVTDGGNLKLNGDFVTSADDTISLVCDGTSWFETARSAN